MRQAQLRAAVAQKEDPAQGELVPRPASAGPKAARPVSVSFDLSPSQAARYEAMMAKIGHRGNKAELLLAMAEALLVEATADPESNVARRRAIAMPAYQVHVHRCPDCAQAIVATPQGERVLSPAEAEATCCDAEVHVPGKRNTSTIPPRIRREVLTRDRHCCRRNGCEHTRYLHLHHLVPRAKGGGNDAENLVTLCTACHDLWHQKGGDLQMMLTAAPQETG